MDGFIGGFSLIAGRQENGRFHIAAHEDQAIETAGAAPGQGFLVVRPEDSRPAAIHPSACLHGAVVSRAFQGRCWRLGIDLGGPRVKLDWPDGLALGSRFEFSLPPSRCVVLSS